MNRSIALDFHHIIREGLRGFWADALWKDSGDLEAVLAGSSDQVPHAHGA
ncbi:MAG: hypothetical protein M3P12_02710 [Gemmatimonadota bacterium]|nr:hypothetical protein [Gemmatimonadota bacterium]